MALHLQHGLVKTAQTAQRVLLVILVLQVLVQPQGQLEARHQLHGLAKTDLMAHWVLLVIQEQLELMAQMVAQEHQEINPLLLVHILLQALLVELVVLEARAVLRAQVALLERKGLQAIQEQ